MLHDLNDDTLSGLLDTLRMFNPYNSEIFVI